MITNEEIKKYYKENYRNEKRGVSLNINNKLMIDFQIMCLELSKKSKKKITPSSVVRKLIVKFLLENHKDTSS